MKYYTLKTKDSKGNYWYSQLTELNKDAFNVGQIIKDVDSPIGRKIGDVEVMSVDLQQEFVDVSGH